MLRTRLKSADRPVVGAEPFTDGLPFVASGVGPGDPEPDGGFQPDVLAARLLAFVSGWRGPDGPLTDDQREWFSWLGPEVNAVLRRGGVDEGGGKSPARRGSEDAALAEKIAEGGQLGGKQRSSETVTGATLMGVRLYDPTTGRFLSVDPVPGGSANAYEYCGGDPLNLYDLDGRFWRGLWRGVRRVHRWTVRHRSGISSFAGYASIGVCLYSWRRLRYRGWNSICRIGARERVQQRNIPAPQQT